MKPLLLAAFAITAFLAVAGTTANAQQNVPARQPFDIGSAADIGKREYVLSCAVCHGERGKGDGSLVEFLKKSPTDLTKIQKNNRGVFPFERLYAVIDGRQVVGAHGREMPVWGGLYRADATEIGSFITPQDAESFVRGRIIALIGYIYALQEK